MVDIQDLVDRVHGLSDLELAVLLSLVSCEHCVIGTPENAVDVLVDELTLVGEAVRLGSHWGLSSMLTYLDIQGCF